MELLSKIKTYSQFRDQILQWKSSTIKMIEDMFELEQGVDPCFCILEWCDDKLQNYYFDVWKLFTSEMDKSCVVNIVKDFCVKKKVVSIMFISEGWMKKLDLGEKVKCPISEYKDKEEVLMITFETFNSVEVFVYDILGNEDFKFLKKKKIQMEELHGKFINLLYSPKFSN